MTDIKTLPSKVVTVRTPWARNLVTFLMVFGPGLIVMEADNDAGAVSTYVQAGAQYGTKLLWLMLLLLPITYFIQEMVARLGIEMFSPRIRTHAHDPDCQNFLDGATRLPAVDDLVSILSRVRFGWSVWSPLNVLPINIYSVGIGDNSSKNSWSLTSISRSSRNG